MKKISVGIADDNEISLEILKMITEEADLQHIRFLERILVY